MKKLGIGIICVIVCFLVLSCKFLVFGDDGVLEEEKKVLFISSYSQDFLTVPDQIKGIESIFDQENIEFDIEYMDTKRFSTQESIYNFYVQLKYKLEHTYEYDGILVGDDAALQFVLDNQEELFKDKPIVFFGVNDHKRAVKACENPFITGMFEKASVIDNIELGLDMIDGVKKVVGVVDGTLTGIGDEEQFMESKSHFPQLEFQVISSKDYSFEELKKVYGEIKEESIVLFFTANTDKNGSYMNMEEQFQFISQYTSVPVFRISVGGVGDGLVGGKLIDYEAFGAESAGMLVDIFNGRAISDIPLVEDTPYYYIFDNDMLEKYNIDNEKVPEGSILINNQISIFEKYRNYFIGIVIVSFFIVVILIVIIIDNIRRRRIEKKLKTANQELTAVYQKYTNAIFGTNSAVWEFEIDSKWVTISRNFESMFGKIIPLYGYYYNVLGNLVDTEYKKIILRKMNSYLKGEIEEINIQVPVTDESGKKRWVLIRGKGVYDLNKKMVSLSGIFLDITYEKSREEYIEYFAKHDYLTKIPNRMDFENTLKRELEDNNKGALMLFDIDDFKSINDTLGHGFGDEILKQISKRLIDICGETIYCARMGGDEFLLVYKDVEVESKVIECINKITEKIFAPFYYDGIEEYINYSMGITFYPKDGNDFDNLMMNADTAMYKVKRGGKNNYAFYHDEMKHEIKKKKEIEKLLRHAVKEDGLYLVYQPQVDVVSGEIEGFEALVRLKDNMISPGVFIPIAEDTGDIIDIGRWVVKEALSQMSKWKKKGFKEKSIAINYSVKQLRDKGYLQYLINTAKEYGISLDKIEIEITEGIFLEKDDSIIDFLKEIRKMGIKLALDDFGSGYSSLSYLTYIPVNKIKLDKSINDKFLEYENITVIESVISLAHGLSLKITAEGIEDIENFEKIKKSGCDYVQGYVFSRPLKKEDVEVIYEKKYF